MDDHTDDLARTDAPDLLPCPFCGCEPRMMRFHLGNVEDIVGVVPDTTPEPGGC